MKKLILLFALAVGCLCASQAFAAEQTNYQNFELDTLLHGIDKPGAPVVTDDYIIFTADTKHRFVGIVFDFEDYKVIHPFQILTQKDDEEKVSRKHMFYVYKRQHKFTELRYRLVFDGLWTTDPLNPNKEYDENVNLYFSKLDNLGSINVYTESPKNDYAHFIFKGETGQKVNLAGTFTNWDPWIYEMVETSPGLYELELLAQELLAGLYLGRFGTSVLGRTALADIADVVVLVGKTEGSEKILKELARSSDERQALLVLRRARSFAYYHEGRLAAAAVDNDVRSVVAKVAFPARSASFLEFGPILVKSTHLPISFIFRFFYLVYHELP